MLASTIIIATSVNYGLANAEDAPCAFDRADCEYDEECRMMWWGAEPSVRDPPTRPECTNDNKNCVDYSECLYNEAIANLETHPDYTGSLSVRGRVELSVTSDGGKLRVQYQLSGLEPLQSGGIHIHSGTTCDEAGDHFWDDQAGTVEDPWSTEYTADASGNADAFFEIDTGYNTVAQNDEHAVVVHAANGERVACGLLEQASEPKDKWIPVMSFGGCPAIEDFGILSWAEINTQCLDDDNCWFDDGPFCESRYGPNPWATCRPVCMPRTTLPFELAVDLPTECEAKMKECVFDSECGEIVAYELDVNLCLSNDLCASAVACIKEFSDESTLPSPLEPCSAEEQECMADTECEQIMMGIVGVVAMEEPMKMCAKNDLCVSFFICAAKKEVSPECRDLVDVCFDDASCVASMSDEQCQKNEKCDAIRACEEGEETSDSDETLGKGKDSKSSGSDNTIIIVGCVVGATVIAALLVAVYCKCYANKTPTLVKEDGFEKPTILP